MLELALLVILALIYLAMSLRIVREHERYVVYRFGKFFKISGSGLLLLMPFVDKVTKVNLAEAFPGWQCLSQTDLEEKIREYVAYRPV